MALVTIHPQRVEFYRTFLDFSYVIVFYSYSREMTDKIDENNKSLIVLIMNVIIYISAINKTLFYESPHYNMTCV